MFLMCLFNIINEAYDYHGVSIPCLFNYLIYIRKENAF